MLQTSDKLSTSSDSYDDRLMLRPTTKDLAKAAGVSRATVDRVLNGRDGVKKNTVEKVNAAIKELGFTRNIQAANLAKSKRYRFVFALPRSGDEFLQEIIQHIRDGEEAFAQEQIWCDVHQIDENDPHSIASFLGSLDPDIVTGVAIMAPEYPQVRDAIFRLKERGVAALPFIANQTTMDTDWIGIDNKAAGATAAVLLGRFCANKSGSILVIAESMQSRDSLERRLGFDAELCACFPNLTALPSLETYGDKERADKIITNIVSNNPKIVGIYVISSEARVPLTTLEGLPLAPEVVRIAHERTPFTVAALNDGRLDCVIAQNTGHLVRSATRKLKAISDKSITHTQQDRIRVEILMRTNL
ncbi:LacI family DNA-binding transcriptional regulator [Roseobacter sp. HKCCD5988]|uniref:LacI family DNA-binding transcriptional regulator n=1 Tax=Roseobacter sp. HKCCD5988 TaxID=3120338 RepID=UPI0030EF227C